MPVLMLQDPQQLHTVEALREALTRANEALGTMSQELEVTHGTLMTTIDTLAGITILRMHGNTDAILATLDDLMARTCDHAMRTSSAH